MEQKQPPKRKLRILWNSNAVFSISGYGNQSRHLLFRFLRDGWNVAQLAFYGLEGGIINIQGLTIYPKIGERWGTDGCIYHADDWKADIVICFQDSWVQNINLVRKIPRYTPYIPIDHDPIPPGVLAKAQLAWRIITYSKFGRDALAKAGYASKYIPHGVDTELFKPLNKAEVRKKHGIPQDIFLFGMVSANKDSPPRKSFQEAMDAFAKFHQSHPKSGIFFHTLLEQQGGFNITQYADHLGIRKAIYFLPPYQMMFKVTPPVIVSLMNTFDVLLSPSCNEGFGLPIIEAQSCGIPVIVNNFTSMPELIIPGKTGLLTKVSWKRWTPLQGYVGHPDTQSLYDCMETIFRRDRKKMGEDAREYMLKDYDIDKLVKNEWTPYFEQIEREIYKGGGK